MIHKPVSQFKNEISETINKAAYGKEHILLQRHGKDVAALISIEELKLLEQIQRLEDYMDVQDALNALNEVKLGKDAVISWKKAKNDLGNKKKERKTKV